MLFKNDWISSIKLEIKDFLEENKKAFDKLDAKTRNALIKRLDRKGLFYARKSVEQLANLLGISRATVYKDLRQIRKENTN